MTTVSSGVTFTVSSGQTDNGEVVLSGGRLQVSGAAVSTIVSGGGQEVVCSGTSSSGTLTVSDGRTWRSST